MDVNSQMILMRKDFKRAKVRVISKLVRHIKNLRSKKGTDIQKTKNANRANRLVEEIQIIKDLRPDSVFKFLLTSSSTLQEISQDLSAPLNDRACIRIGDVPFIKEKMQEIKNQVSSFDSVRSEKEDTTSIKVATKLAKLEASSTKVETTSAEEQEELIFSSDHEKLAEESKETSTEPSDETVQSVSPPETISIPKKDSQISVSSNNPQKETPVAKEVTLNIESNNDIIMEAKSEQAEVKEEETIEETGIKVVMPEYYTKKTEEEPKRAGVDLSQVTHTDDIADLWENVGKGFSDSEDDFRDGEDRVDVDEESDKEGDDDDMTDSFFLGDDDMKIKDQKTVKSTTDITKSFPFRSCFVTSLTKNTTSKINPNKTVGKKNRLGQRERRKLYGGTDEISKPNKTRNPKDKNFSKRPNNKNQRENTEAKKNPKRKTDFGKSEADKNPAEEKMHPSWLASQARKQQQQIHAFQGKKIKFDDSD